jgi:hypothetical protein
MIEYFIRLNRIAEIKGFSVKVSVAGTVHAET